MALYRALAAMAVPVADEQNTCTVVCHDPWVSFLLKAITVAGIVMCCWKCLKLAHICYDFKFNNYCSLYFYNTCYFEPIKVADTHGRLHQFTIENKLSIENISLQKCLTWDTLHIDWGDVKIKMGSKYLALPTDITIPLEDKMRQKHVLGGQSPNVFILVKQGSIYYSIGTAGGASVPSLSILLLLIDIVNCI